MPDQEPTDPVAYRCKHCGGIAAYERMRCKDCGSGSFLCVPISTIGTVLAATHTTAAGFTVVEFDDGLRVMAHGPPRLHVGIGDRIPIRQEADGTFCYSPGGN